MTFSTPSDDDLSVAPKLAILATLELNLAITAQLLNIAHTEISAPGADPYIPDLDSNIAATLIAQASLMTATINRYRLARRDPDPFRF